jgi:putative membrane protein
MRLIHRLPTTPALLLQTEGQARSRIEADDFADVSGLQKDDSGVWRGKAKKDGKEVDVALDFQGNVVAK